MLTLEWKITMSLSYYMAYQKKKKTKTNAMKEKDTYAKYYTILTSRKKKINDLISENS